MSKILKIVFGFLLLALIIYLLISIQVKQEISSESISPNFIMEFNDVKLRGWDKEKIVWEMVARDAFYYDRNNLILLNVDNGFFANEQGNNLIYKLNISTVNVIVNRKECFLKGYELLISSNQKDVSICGNEIKYADNIFETEKYFLMNFDGWELSSKKMRLDINKNLIDFLDEVELKKHEDTINAKKGIWLPLENKSSFFDDVGIKYALSYKEKEYNVFISTNLLEILFGTDSTVFEFPNGMVLRFDEDVLQSEYARGDLGEKELNLSRAVIRVEDGSVVLNNIEEKELKGTLIRAGKMNIDFKNKEVHLSMGVTYEKGKQIINSNNGFYDVNKGVLHMNSNVSIQEGNKKINSNDLVVDVKNNVIIAKGNVKTRLQF